MLAWMSDTGGYFAGRFLGRHKLYEAVSPKKTVEGALGRIGENVQRIRELAVQSANGVISDDDRAYLQAEATQLQEEVKRIVDNTRFNGLEVLDGSYPSPVSFQVGPESTDTVNVETTSFVMTGLNVYGDADISSEAGARALIDQIDTDLEGVNTARAASGAVQSRMESIVMQLQIFSENTAAARSRIMDTDYAQETANLARVQILQQAGSAMLTQANNQPQMVMQLLQGLR
jgi:flagellin